MLSYYKLTKEQKAILCNGWGPKGGGAVVPELFLHEPCDRHDFDYWVGGSILDRLKADWRLLRSGMRKAKWNPAMNAAAMVYFTAVRLCGVICFHYGKKRDEADLAELMKEEKIV